MKQKIQQLLFTALLVGVAGFFYPLPSYAQKSVDDCAVGPIILEVPFGNVETSEGLPQYIAEMFEFIIFTVIILAVVMVMFAGIKWAAAAGNQSMIGDSKERLQSAFIGLAIALSSYIILNAINPGLTILPSICPDALEFADNTSTTWYTCGDVDNDGRGDVSTCEDVPYCNYSDAHTVKEECSCVNISKDNISNYVCRPNQDGIVPLGGSCHKASNCTKIPGTNVSCVGNSTRGPGECSASTEGIPCETKAQCSSGESCVEEKYETEGISNGTFCMSDTSREEGQFCEKDSECSSNACDTRFTQKCLGGDPGDTCFEDPDCGTGYKCEGKCVAKGVGEGCDTNADCQNDTYSNYCVDQKTDTWKATAVDAVTDLYGWTGTCFAGNEKDYCDTAGDCSSAAPHCIDEGDYNRCYDGSEGDPCTYNGDCQSNDCDQGFAEGTAAEAYIEGECTAPSTE